MIEIIRSVTIGAVQGIAEFFPISSSGHLVLLPYIFKWDYQGLSFDVALHFGTLIAIIVYFWKDWMSIIAKAIRREKKAGSEAIEVNSKMPSARNGNAQPPTPYTLPNNLLWQILIASIPAALLGFFLNDYVEQYLHSPILIALNLMIFGIILWLVDKYSKNNKSLSTIGYKQTFWIGCAQALALFPGVSRSGITMTACRSWDLDRKDSARLSFLLATPAMAGAFLLKLKDIEGSNLNSVFWAGTIASTIFGFIAIKYLLKYLERGNFSIFVWYRIVVALIIFAIYFTR